MFFFTLFIIAGKVFVTYEADSEKHVKEIINFVALLRHNGFYTHVRHATYTKHCLAAMLVTGCWVCQRSSVLFVLFAQIDMFEQQFKSISKIDFMERYISEVSRDCLRPPSISGCVFYSLTCTA